MLPSAIISILPSSPIKLAPTGCIYDFSELLAELVTRIKSEAVPSPEILIFPPVIVAFLQLIFPFLSTLKLLLDILILSLVILIVLPLKFILFAFIVTASAD